MYSSYRSTWLVGRFNLLLWQWIRLSLVTCGVWFIFFVSLLLRTHSTSNMSTRITWVIDVLAGHWSLAQCFSSSSSLFFFFLSIPHNHFVFISACAWPFFLLCAANSVDQLLKLTVSGCFFLLLLLLLLLFLWAGAAGDANDAVSTLTCEMESES